MSLRALDPNIAQYAPAVLYAPRQGKFAEAEPLYVRCQMIEEKVLGPEHPSLAATLNNRRGC